VVIRSFGRDILWVDGQFRTSSTGCYAGYRFPGEVISHAVWLYFRFPLSLRMMEEMLARREP
jgi:transposase-like protein